VNGIKKGLTLSDILLLKVRAHYLAMNRRSAPSYGDRRRIKSSGAGWVVNKVPALNLPDTMRWDGGPQRENVIQTQYAKITRILAGPVVRMLPEPVDRNPIAEMERWIPHCEISPKWGQIQRTVLR
jgi:hypothetical protein